jgi:Flp pilus assembly protein TadB
MRLFLGLVLAFAPVAVSAQAQQEDEAHRVDRQQTQDLNRSVQRSVAQRQAADAAKLARYRDANAAYERQRDEWRRRVAACEGGDTSACDPY